MAEVTKYFEREYIVGLSKYWRSNGYHEHCYAYYAYMIKGPER